MQGSLARVPCIQGGKDKGKKQKGQEAIDLVSGATKDMEGNDKLKKR